MAVTKHKIEIGGKVSQVTPPATQADHVPQFGQIPTLEHQLNGKRITANVSGTYVIDWNAASVFVLTMTANTTFSSVNLPTGDNSKVINIELTGAFVPTFPTTWKLMPNATAYDGAKLNLIWVNCLNGTAASEKIRYNNEPTT